MIGKRALLFCVAAAALSGALSRPAPAETYPDRPIKLIVTVAAGGPRCGQFVTVSWHTDVSRTPVL